MKRMKQLLALGLCIAMVGQTMDVRAFGNGQEAYVTEVLTDASVGLPAQTAEELSETEAKKSAEETTEEAAGESAEATTETAAGESVEEAAELATEKPAEGVTEAAAEEPVEDATEAVTEQSTEELSEIVTEQPSEAETETIREPEEDTELTPTGDLPGEDSTEENTEEDTEKESIRCSRIVLTNTELTLAPGKSSQLAFVAYDEDGYILGNLSATDYSYESSDSKLVSVDDKGMIQAISADKKTGKSVVTIRVTCGGMTAECKVEVANEITLNKTKCTLYTTQKNGVILRAKVNPSGTVTWKTTNKKAAIVDKNGKVIPKGAGKATITATANGVSTTCSVTVKKPTLTLKGKKTLYVKNSVTFTAKATPAAKITWKSSNKKIATVSSKGVVTPKKTGTVTISASANGVTKTYKVTVKKPSVKITSTQKAVFEKNSFQIWVKAKPSDQVKYKTSNKKIATVDKNGQVTGVKSGTVTITAYVPGAKASCKVKVVKNRYSLNRHKATIMTGKTARFSVKNMSSYQGVSYYLDDNNVASTVSSKDNVATVKASGKSTAVLVASTYIYVDGDYLYWRDTCQIKVCDFGITDQDLSIAKKTSHQMKLKNAGRGSAVKSVKWISENTKIAAINAKSGLVKGKKAGSTHIKALVTCKNGKRYTYRSSLRISDPKLKAGYRILLLGQEKKLALTGTNSYSNISYKSAKKSVVSVTANGTLYAKKTGNSKVTITVDGKKLSCTIYVTNPSLQSSYACLAPGDTAQITINGTCSKSAVSYRSENGGVAGVTEGGTVIAAAGGSTNIIVTVDGKEMKFWVEVASRDAINACRGGYQIITSSTYSQPYRMTPGYYDCSSLVFRAYGCNAALLGGSASWAPTAAGMASHLEAAGKVIAYQAVDVSQLRPGDLIFYGGRDNGRYRGIYHVSMYYGQGSRLEKPLYSYWPLSNIVMIARPVP